MLTLALACGAAEQPQQPVQPASQAQPAAQPQMAAQTAPMEQVTQDTTTNMAAVDQSMKAESAGQIQPELMASQEMNKEMTTEPPASAEVMTDKATEAQPEPMAKAMNTQVEPAAATAEPAAPLQEAMEPKDMGGSEPAVKQVPQAPPAPEATEAPAPVVAEPVPAAPTSPEATEAPAPVVTEPLPEVGNEVGYRVPEFSLELVGGTIVSTSGLIEQGKPTFVFFTSTT